MPSKTSETREKQIKSYDQSIQARRAALEKKGMAPNEINKDKVCEHLMAKRRAVMKAMNAIAVSKARNQPRQEAAVEQAAPVPDAPKEKKPKKEKAAKAAPAKGHK